MAGRGTDIILGGNAEFLADKKLHDSGIDALENSEEYESSTGSSKHSRRRPGLSTTRSWSLEGFTSSAPNGTSRAASTTSSAAVPAVRAIPGEPVLPVPR